MNTRGLPGTLAPRYHELHDGEQREVGDLVHVVDPRVLRLGRRPRCAGGRCRARYSMQSVIQFTCCSIETTMLVSTDGLPGPVMVKRLGKPDTAEARDSVRGPSAHASAGAVRRDHGCRCSSSAPVIASKPVAKTMQSSSNSPVADPQSVGGDLLDRRLAHVDELDVVAVEGLEVAGVDAQPLAADHGLRRQTFGDRRDPSRSRGSSARTNSAAVSLALAIEEQVDEGARGTAGRRAPSAPRRPGSAPRARPRGPRRRSRVGAIRSRSASELLRARKPA